MLLLLLLVVRNGDHEGVLRVGLGRLVLLSENRLEGLRAYKVRRHPLKTVLLTQI